MNVLLINGSPHKKGCTYTALSEVAGQLEKNGIGSNIDGSGKSTLAKHINAILKPTEGEMTVDGMSTSEEDNGL